MNRRAALIVLVQIAFIATAHAAPQVIESWADPAMPVQGGLALWLDVMRQDPAREAAAKPALSNGDSIDVWYDGSGRARHFAQASADARPRYLSGNGDPAVRFDGKDDHLRWSGEFAPLSSFTAVIVAGPRSNAGQFRGILAGWKTGQNDYRSGFTIDLGPEKADIFDGFDQLNVEGNGFGGAANLLEASSPFEQLQAIIVTAQPSGADAIRCYLNGQPMGSRGRETAQVAVENLCLGARYYTNEGGEPLVRGFLDGDIVEMLLFDRVLTPDELAAMNGYLVRKHAGLVDSFARRSESAATALKVLDNVPAVQMFVPGFSARQLPLDLNNINNVRYREDGKLVALAYDGTVYLLSDTNGDGLEDKAELFWDNGGPNGGRISQPIGMALTPPNYARGRGVFVANKGKLSLLADTDGDDRADAETVVATGWPLSFHGVDALGVAIDPRDGAIYFGVGTTNFADPLLMDKQGKSHYDLAGERGTIMRVAPDFSKREIVCTGIRFPVGLAFNPAGDLFATDQEGATWVPNGNPLDELLHIQPGRHYGFPARHPTHLPNVIDEPSTFDYGPQHQSTCGLFFNEPVNGGPTFGPPTWRGDAIICGESRGKLYRTTLAKSPAGYVARTQLIGSIPMLLIDACVSPSGDLVATAHSGPPDWGTGPTGKGKLYKISYRDSQPQPVLCWPARADDVRIAFDREIDPATLPALAKSASIEAGAHVAAGDRFEKIRPGYAIVKRQRQSPRSTVAVTGATLSDDRRTLVLKTANPQAAAIGYALTLAGAGTPTGAAHEITQVNAIDLAYDLSGVAVDWRGDADGAAWTGWLPHPDLGVAKTFVRGSADHDRLWTSLRAAGRLTLRTSLDLENMLRPAVQPGSRLDFAFPPERVTLSFQSNAPLDVRSGDLKWELAKADDGTHVARLTITPKPGEWLPVEIALPTGGSEPTLAVSFITQEDDRPRPLSLRRFILPWAMKARSDVTGTIAAAPAPTPPELAGGDWLRGRAVFFGNESGCYKCHQVRGQGSDLGPDLSNLIHRDYESVLRDIREPSAALNPDYIASAVAMTDGRVFHGLMRGAPGIEAERFIVRGDYEGERTPLKLGDVKKVTPSPLSIMPSGMVEGLGPDKMRDLLTFLLTEPLPPAPIQRRGAPPPRPRGEVEAVLRSARDSIASPAHGPGDGSESSTVRPMTILLVAGKKDHGPGEHDYPAWQKRWATLLGLADNVKVEQADEWPTPSQWEAANVAVFYCAHGAWSADKAGQLDAFLARGGGLVYVHYAVDGRDAPDALADRIGLAWRGGASRFRHGPLALNIRDTAHPITRGFPSSASFVDETYWNLIGDEKRIHLLADGEEDKSPRPLLWTREHGKGRVFVSILGHYAWTFDDPLFRLLLLRGICWTAHEPADRLSGLATIGARME